MAESELVEVICFNQTGHFNNGISVEALKLTSGELLSVKVVEEQPLNSEESSLFYSQRIRVKD